MVSMAVTKFSVHVSEMVKSFLVFNNSAYY